VRGFEDRVSAVERAGERTGNAMYPPEFFGTQFDPRGLKNGTHFVRNNVE
jgi:hypothetical protein